MESGGLGIKVCDEKTVKSGLQKQIPSLGVEYLPGQIDREKKYRKELRL